MNRRGGDALPTHARPPTDELVVPQRAEVDWRFGRRVRLRTAVEVTPVGLVAIGGLVSGILLSSAVIVHVATRHLSRRPAALPWRGPLR